MSRTSDDNGNHRLRRERSLVGTPSTEEALREAMRTAAARREVEALMNMEGLDLADEKIMKSAWRC